MFTLSPNPSSLRSLLTQFYARYPTGSLVAELLTIHQDRYVVRALVRLGGTTLATAMATATEVEQAEDRAKVRVLEELGIQPAEVAFNGYEPLPPAPRPPAPIDFMAPGKASANVMPPAPIEPSVPPLQSLSHDVTASAPPAPSFLSVPEKPQVDLEPAPLFDQVPEDEIDYGESYAEISYGGADYTTDPTFDAVTEPVTEPAAQPVAESIAEPAPRPGKSKRKADTPKTAPAAERASDKTPEPPIEKVIDRSFDRSEEIARIGVEMKRLSWTTEEGRDYLKRTYGKRSRQELEDAELLDFLSYLESQPSPVQSPF